MRRVTTLIIVAACWLPWSLWASEPTAPTKEEVTAKADDDGAAENAEDPERKGYLSTKYTQRAAKIHGESFRDADLFGQLSLDLKLSEDNRYKFHFLGNAKRDLDGEQETKSFHPFEDINDTRRSRDAGYIYEFYFDIAQATPWLENVRLGRQFGTRDELLFFDGVNLDMNLSESWKWSVYGGKAVHFYEPKPGDDSLRGTGLDFFPRKGSKISVDYLAVRDVHEALTGDEWQENELVSLKYWQRFSSSARGMAKFRWIDGKPKDFVARVIKAFPDNDLFVNGNYWRQLRTQKNLVNEFSPFFGVLGKSLPYHTLNLNMRKFWGEHYAIDLGLFQRKLLEDHGESEFNREYGRVFATFEIYDLMADNLSLTLIGDYWDGKKKVNSSGVDLSYWLEKRGKGKHVALGIYYSLYKYEEAEFFRRESYDVRTYYLRGEMPVWQSLALNGSYESEDSRENYRALKAGVRYDF